MTTPSPDRSRPPAPGTAKLVSFPPFERSELDNGLELLLLPKAGVPRIELALVLDAGGEHNPAQTPGLASLTASLVDEGTERRDGPTIASDVERLGGTLTTRADWDSAELEVEVLRDDLDAGLDLLAEIARRPVFPDREVERLKRLAAIELVRRRDRPGTLAEEALFRELYRGTPYGELLIGTEVSLARTTRADVANFHARRYLPSGAALIVVGDFDPESAYRRAVELFADWAGAKPAPAPAIEPPVRQARKVVVVDRPGAAQTELRLGHVALARTHPDRTRLSLLNAALGGKFTSRINLNLRERHGYTYGASSRFVDRRGPGPFVVSTAVATPVAGPAVGEILSELERIREAPLSAEEIAETKSYLLGVFPYTLQAARGLLARLEDVATFDLPSDHFDRSLGEIARTEADELLVLARRHLAPDRIVIVAAGPAQELVPQLERFAPEIETLTVAEPPTLAAGTASVGAGSD